MHDHESPDFGLTDPNLSSFEARLAGLAPHSEIDRDRLMFAAGRRSANKHLRVINRMLAGTSLVLAAVAGLSTVQRIAGQPAVAPTPTLAEHASEMKLMVFAEPEPAHDQREYASAAPTNGPTNQQLLRMWENGQSFDNPIEQGSNETLVPAITLDPTSPSTSRELLLHYLQSPSERL